MPFLVYPDDFTSAIKNDNLNSVLEGNAAFLNDAMSRAQSLITGFGAFRYNMAVEFAKTGDARDPLLIQFMVALSLYNVHKRINPKMIPAIRETDKKDTMELLREIQAGKFQANWLENVNEKNEPESGRRFGNDEPFRISW